MSHQISSLFFTPSQKYGTLPVYATTQNETSYQHHWPPYNYASPDLIPPCPTLPFIYWPKRADPTHVMWFKPLSILLHKVFNDKSISSDWLSLFFNQNFNVRNWDLNFYDKSNYKIGKNFFSNRFVILNKLIEYGWLNQKFKSFKIKCKPIF